MVVMAPDRPELFCRVIGALDAQHLQIQSARIDTSSSGLALETINILDRNAHPITDPVLLAELEQRVYDAMHSTHKLTPRRRRLKRNKAFSVLTQVEAWHGERRGQIELHITTADAPGVLHIICSTLNQSGMRIHRAQAATFGEKVEDTFTISPLNANTNCDLPWLRQSIIKALDSDKRS